MSSKVEAAIRTREEVKAKGRGVGPDESYRDLQAKAKDLGIPATGSRDELEAAVAKATEAEG